MIMSSSSSSMLKEEGESICLSYKSDEHAKGNRASNMHGPVPSDPQYWKGCVMFSRDPHIRHQRVYDCGGP